LQSDELAPKTYWDSAMTGKKKGKTYGEVLDLPPRQKSKDKCGFDQTIQLQRVNPANIATLRKGSKVTIDMKREGTVPSIVCGRLDSTKIIGSVAFAGVERLIKCIKEGRTYEGEIVMIDGTAIHVRIYDT
jgi:hypothetical protein